MSNIEKIASISNNRTKAKEIASRVIKQGNKTGERFGDILQEEIDKLKATKDTGKVVQGN